MHPRRLLFSPCSSFLSRRVLAASAACALAGATALHAETLYWKSGSGNWSTGSNWNPNNTAPTANDLAVIDTGNPQITAADAVASSVAVGNSLSGQLTISSGGTLATTSAIVGKSSGSVTVTGSGSSWDTDTGAGFLDLGYFGGTGVLSIANGGLVNSGDVHVANSGTSNLSTNGTVTVDGVGSIWNVAGSVAIGDGARGAATFTISNGGVATHHSAGINGATTGSASSATVDGSGSAWNVATSLWLLSYGRSATLSLTNSGAVNVNSGTGTLNLGENTTLNLGTGGGAGTLNAAAVDAYIIGPGTAAVNFNHTGTATFPANLQHSINVTKAGNGTTSLTGAGNTFTGTTTISAGTLQIGNGGAASFGSGAVVNNSALAVNSASTVAIPGTISGSGTLTKTGSGTLALSGANSYTGGTTVSGGLVEFNSAASFGNSGTITLSGGGLRWASGSTADISPRLAALGTAGTPFDTNGNNVSLATALTGTGGLAKNGAGTLNLTGASTYSGATTINAGTLQLTGGDASSSASFGSAITNNSALAFNHGYGLLFLKGGISGTGTVNALGGTTIINHASSYSGDTFVEGGATLRVWESLNTNSAGIYVGHQGTGTLALWSTLTSGNAYLGIFNGDAGYAYVSGTWTAPTVIIGYGGGGVLNFQSGTINADIYLGSVSAGVGTFNIGTGDPSHAGLTLTLNATSIIGGANGGKGGTVNFNHTGAFSTAAAITGKVAVTKSYPGTTTLSGANTFTGSTTISDGTLALGSSSALSPNSALIINGGGGTLALGNYSGTDASLAGNSGTITLGGNLTVNQSGNTSYAGALSGTSGNLIKLGTGALTLAGTSAFSGTTSVNGGALNVSGSLSTGGVHIGENGFTGAMTVSGALTANSFLTVGDNNGGAGSGGTGALTIANGAAVTLGNGAKLTVGWLNATGSLDVQSGGRLEIGGADGLQKHATGTAAVTLSGGTIQVTNAALTTSLPMTLSGTGSTIDTNGLAATFSGALSGSGSLTKSGTGTLSLSAANSYTGSTTVNGGTLALSTASLANAAEVSIASGAALQLGFSGTDTIGALYLNGIQQPDGVWGGMSSTAPNKTPYLTGTGLLNVAASGTMTFADWIATFGLSGNDALASADPDHDGLANLLEWALGGNPTQNDGAARQPQVSRDGNELVVTFQRSDASELDGGLALAAGYSANLKTWTEVEIGAASAVAGDVTITIEENDGSPDDITVRIPLGTNPALFARLRATEN